MCSKGNLDVLGKTKKKYKTFSVPVKNEIIKIDKEGIETVQTIPYNKALF